jgi:predicted GIY-YIG superfamily endonuclease
VGWFVYVLASAERTRTYVGVARDVAKRVAQHNGEERGGARSTRAGRPWSVGVVYGPYRDRGEAQRAEARVRGHAGAARLTVESEPRAC